MKKFLMTVGIALAMPLCAIAQAESKPKPAPVPPTLTELQSVKMENLELKLSTVYQQAQAATQPLQAERQKLIQEIEAEHPGYKWHESMGQGDKEGLQPISPPPAPPQPAKK